MKKSTLFSIAFVAFLVTGCIDSALYTYHAFKNDYYFVAQLDFILDYHTSGVGLICFAAWLVSTVVLLATTFWMDR